MVTEVCIMKVDFEVSWVSETSETDLLRCSGQDVRMNGDRKWLISPLLPTAHFHVAPKDDVAGNKNLQAALELSKLAINVAST